MERIGEWLSIIGLSFALALLLMYCGVLLSAMFIIALLATLLATICRGVSFLFSRSGAKGEKNERFVDYD